MFELNGNLTIDEIKDILVEYPRFALRELMDFTLTMGALKYRFNEEQQRDIIYYLYENNIWLPKNGIRKIEKLDVNSNYDLTNELPKKINQIIDILNNVIKVNIYK